MKKTLLTKLTALCLVLGLLLPGALSVRAAERDPIYDMALDSQGAYLMNLETRSVVYEKNARARMFPASLTKMLTALVVLEKCPDTEGTTIAVPDTSLFQAIIDEGGVNMEMRQGEVFTVQDLLLGMMLNSFCDAAELLAWHFGGTDTGRFVAMMNEKAAAIGMEDSHFANAHGLHDPEHWSSPHDIALLLEEAVKDDRFVSLITARSGFIPATEYHDARPLIYTVSIFYPQNEYYLDAFVGGKSGFTDEAGRCLASYSTKDGVSYICVMMGANMDSSRRYGRDNMAWIETSTLVSYAYENFALQTLLKKGQEMTRIPVLDSETKLSVTAGEDLTLLTRAGTEPEYRLDLPEAISATEAEDGAVVGRVTLLLGGEETERSCPLLLKWDGTPIHTKSFLEKEGAKAGEAIRRIFSEDRAFVILIILLVVVIAVSIPAVKITQHLRKKKAKKPKH